MRGAGGAGGRGGSAQAAAYSQFVRQKLLSQLLPALCTERAFQSALQMRGLADALPQAAHVVRLRNGFARDHFVSATSVALKRVVRAELEQLWARVGAVPAPSSGPGHVA